MRYSVLLLAAAALAIVQAAPLTADPEAETVEVRARPMNVCITRRGKLLCKTGAPGPGQSRFCVKEMGDWYCPYADGDI
ncbi:hypothetical protein BGZ95_002097 [Linnemannia exigua]|uniref:Uncharacterized protein n=1 Tax=Linnemannia exigua TaxID=604196 RepID=A0AAD4D5Y7_9FUNG|nr:hypothetical protein BGZ95_002097 [Linnemannia exigua]